MSNYREKDNVIEQCNQGPVGGQAHFLDALRIFGC
jgi:hypothetical protein